MLKVKFKKLNDKTKLPVKGSENAACFDVYATEVVIDNPTHVTYKLGFATEFPKGWKGVIVPRSNLAKTDWCLGNSIGIVDADYRGEWMVKMKSETPYSSLPYQEGERVAQIYFDRVEDVVFMEEIELSSSERGEGGFGSTGVK